MYTLTSTYSNKTTTTKKSENEKRQHPAPTITWTGNAHIKKIYFLLLLIIIGYILYHFYMLATIHVFMCVLFIFTHFYIYFFGIGIQYTGN